MRTQENILYKKLVKKFGKDFLILLVDYNNQMLMESLINKLFKNRDEHQSIRIYQNFRNTALYHNLSIKEKLSYRFSNHFLELVLIYTTPKITKRLQGLLLEIKKKLKDSSFWAKKA